MENTKTVLFKTNYNETSAGDPHYGIPSEWFRYTGGINKRAEPKKHP